MLNAKEEYINIIKDLSGSTAQNRFKYQIYWAINKIYELYDSNEEFTVIFDYASDIDIFVNEELHFYQLKTDKNKNFTIERLIRKEPIQKQSILSKLANLDKNKEIVKSLNVVANTNLSIKEETGQNLQIICFGNLKEEIQSKIVTHIQEVSKITPNLSKYFYIKSDLCIDSSYYTLLGKTVEFLRKKFDTTNIRTEGFLKWLIIMAESKTTYEYNTNNFDEAIKNKGITKEEISNQLSFYDYTNNKILERVEQLITENFELNERHELSKALNQIIGSKLNPTRHNEMLKQINNFISNNQLSLSPIKKPKDIIQKIIEKVSFSLGYEDYEKMCLSIMGFALFEKGLEKWTW